MSEKTVVQKFGSSVLRSAGDLHIAVDEIYRHWRTGCRVLAVVSAFEDVTDILMGEIVERVGAECPEATAAYLATREEQTAALLFISGGENIYSLEVEAILVRHPSVRQCAVIGIPHPVWGEAVHAIVTLNHGESFDELALIDFCRGQLSGYKLPRSIEHRDELPLTAAGKVMKRDLRAPFWAHLAPSHPTPRL